MAMPIRLRMPFITYRSLIFISSEPISKKPRLVHVWSETGLFFRVLLYLRTEWAMAYLKHQQQYYPYQIIPIYLKNRFFLLFLVNWVNVWSVILECRAFYSKFHDCAKPFSCCCRLFVHIALFYILCYCASCLSYISFGCLFGAYKF